jgi:hypothetical protein
MASWERQALQNLSATLKHFSPGEDVLREGDKPRWCAWWLMERLFDLSCQGMAQLFKIEHIRGGRGSEEI